MNPLAEVAGELCKILLPISEEKHLGNASSTVAVCTLSSMDLLKKFQHSGILNHICIAGRLLSENKGIDSLLDYVYDNGNIKTIIVCGQEVWGHMAGHSLLELHKNGTDPNGRIINSQSPDPYVTSSGVKIKYFQQNIRLVDMIGQTDLMVIESRIKDNFL